MSRRAPGHADTGHPNCNTPILFELHRPLDNSRNKNQLKMPLELLWGKDNWPRKVEPGIKRKIDMKKIMVHKLVRRPTRSLYLCLACLSLALHLFLVFFCVAVLQTACVPPLSSSSSSAAVQRAANQNACNSSTLRVRTTELTRTDRITVEDSQVKGRSKLEELFNHPLYNLSHPKLQEDDWLLKLKPEDKKSGHIKDSDFNSNWESASVEKGYEKISWTRDASTHPPWLRFHLGITRWQLYDRRDPILRELMHYLATERILGAVQKSGGTQLKLVISFPNYGQALLKPMKQARDAETDLNLYYFSDFERHNAEIAAFHLDRVLGFNRIPPVVGRLINVTTEIREITTDRKLSRTFFKSPVGNVCFYGQSWRSPWRRSYSRTKLAQWEKDPNYCDTVKQTPPYDQGTRLVDVIDMAILDFLMSNMDRHHYETFETFGNQTFLLHLDNGRA
ncbi:hypothetical protein WMY93_003158 [Mugilogobius chulae]|uniref:FAM20 C-terminal domain-containing protein n=1 Tax=Mugilogobius chulae TaxID=88201 RepID=A0AAW0Q5N3_9GOBI